MANKEFDERSTFPRIKGEDVDTVIERFGSGIFDKGPFRTEVYDRTMPKIDPALHNRIDMEGALIGENIPGADEYMVPEIQYGAAFMFSVMEELRNDGYRFPRLKSDTAMTDKEQESRVYEDIKKGLEAHGPEGLGITDILDIAATADRTHGRTTVTTNDILMENPGLVGVFDKLNMGEQTGARSVYRLVKKQYEVNEMEELLGGTDTGVETD